MTDQERIEQLERKLSLLKRGFGRFVKGRIWENNYTEAVKRMRESAQESLEEAELLEELIPLLREKEN